MTFEHVDSDDTYSQTEIIRQSNEAIYGGENTKQSIRALGWLTGEVGPKGQVSSILRNLSRANFKAHKRASKGSSMPNGILYVLIPMLLIAIFLILVVAIFGWLIT